MNLINPLSLLRAALSRANRRLNIVATGDENAYYAWADERLDQLAAEVRRPAYQPGTIRALRVSGTPDDEQAA